MLMDASLLPRLRRCEAFPPVSTTAPRLRRSPQDTKAQEGQRGSGKHHTAIKRRTYRRDSATQWHRAQRLYPADTSQPKSNSTAFSMGCSPSRSMQGTSTIIQSTAAPLKAAAFNWTTCAGGQHLPAARGRRAVAVVRRVVADGLSPAGSRFWRFVLSNAERMWQIKGAQTHLLRPKRYLFVEYCTAYSDRLPHDTTHTCKMGGEIPHGAQ